MPHFEEDDSNPQSQGADQGGWGAATGTSRLEQYGPSTEADIVEFALSEHAPRGLTVQTAEGVAFRQDRRTWNRAVTAYNNHLWERREAGLPARDNFDAREAAPHRQAQRPTQRATVVQDRAAAAASASSQQVPATTSGSANGQHSANGYGGAQTQRSPSPRGR